MHCHRDFKDERPEEYESWREMYLRLQDAREQRLRVLTKNIRSAHANKPKGTAAGRAGRRANPVLRSRQGCGGLSQGGTSGP